MHRQLAFRRPSAAMVIAVIPLFAALGGVGLGAVRSASGQRRHGATAQPRRNQLEDRERLGWYAQAQARRG